MLLKALIPTHRVASWLLKVVDSILSKLGLAHSDGAEEVAYTIIVLGMAMLIGWAVRKLIVVVVRKLVYSRKTVFVEEMQHQHIVEKCSHIIPPLVFLALIPFAFNTDSHALVLLERVVLVYFVAMLGLTVCALFNILWVNYDRTENTRNLPLKGILNVAKGLVWIVLSIVAVAIMLDKSPAALLAGLGAFAAALMLIFKDPILGFVAGLQLSFNDMLHVGDWIEVPGTIVNGIVTDVSLTAVKVRNWNNTTVTVPPYSLVSNSLQNWSKMKERGRRQIERSVTVDVTTVRPTTPEMLEDLKKLPFMKDYIDTMQEFARKGEATSLKRGGITVNGSIDTNLGVFRAYVGLYISHHPYVTVGDPKCLCMVRTLQPEPQGIPLQLFCYVNTTNWVEYEGIQSDIFEHIIAVAPAFGLSVYCAPAGRDVVNIANPAPQAMPYNGNQPVDMPAYQPKTNYVVPPNLSGDPGFAVHDQPIYPADMDELVKAANADVSMPDNPAPVSSTPPPTDSKDK